jgi:hypothetical protein
MKQLIFNILKFLKKPSVFGKLFLLGGACVFLFAVFIPDLKFNILSKNPVTLSIEEISKIKKEDLPRYIIVSNAQPLRVSKLASKAEIDSINPSFNKLSSALSIQIESYNYVLEQKVKSGDTILSSISYPVYSKDQIKKNPKVSASDIKSFVVIRDSNIKEADLKDDNYFKSPTFVVKGQFDGAYIDEETLKLMETNGYNISKEAVILERGRTPISLNASIILTLLSSIFIVFFLASFLPLDFISKKLRLERIE